MINGKKMLVVSAHAADYVWRAGGTIAKYIKHGAEVHLVVLSFGGRGESNDLWKQPGFYAGNIKSPLGECFRGEGANPMTYGSNRAPQRSP